MDAYVKMATTKKRNYLIMDVAKNLQKTARSLTLSYFKAPHFACRALVAFGEPSKEFVTAVQKRLYDKAVEKKKAEVNHKKNQWTRAQALKAKKKEAEENLKAKKAAAEAEKKKKEEEKKAEEKKEEGKEEEGKEEEKKEEEPAKEEKAEEAKEEAAEETKEEPKEEEEPEPDWEEMMKVDAEQFKEIKFMPNAWSDIHPDQESQIFHNFSIPVEGVIPERADRRWLPEGETLPPPGPEEGFAKVDFAWADKAGASAALDEWVKTKKKNEMVRNFRASKESQARLAAWNKSKPDEDTKEYEEKPEAADEKKEEEPA